MDQAGHHSHHITPLKTLAYVFGGLVILTVTTVVTAQIDLGVFNVPLALTIATAKACLVVVFFMALKWDNKVNTLILSIGVLFAIVFVVFTLFDTAFRGDLSNVDSTTISEQERAEAGLSATTPLGAVGDAEEGESTPSEDAPDNADH